VRVRLRGTFGVCLDGESSDAEATSIWQHAWNTTAHSKQHPNIGAIVTRSTAAATTAAAAATEWTPSWLDDATISKQRLEQQSERLEWLAFRHTHAHEASHIDQLKSAFPLAQVEWLRQQQQSLCFLLIQLTLFHSN